jgi:hypothetical protein
MERGTSSSCRATEAFRHLFVLTCKSASTPFHCFLANDHGVFSHVGVVFLSFSSGFSLFQVQFVVDTLCAGVYSFFPKTAAPRLG